MGRRVLGIGSLNGDVMGGKGKEWVVGRKVGSDEGRLRGF